jgi:hypothetical protein
MGWVRAPEDKVTPLATATAIARVRVDAFMETSIGEESSLTPSRVNMHAYDLNHTSSFFRRMIADLVPPRQAPDGIPYEDGSHGVLS